MSNHVNLAPVRLASRYELGQLIGVGGMGKVVEGWDMRLERPVAVKLLQPFAPDEHGVRIKREALAAAKIRDPRIVTVLDYGDDPDEGPYIVFELLDGSTLADALTDGPMSEARHARLVDDLLGGLAAAHAVDVLHRDVTPSNILLDGPAFRITDFGLASLGTDPTDDELMGTLGYVAPERFFGREATAASDVFSAAAVLHEACSGRQPFRGSTAAETYANLQNGRCAPLPSWLPDDTRNAILTALEPNPDARPADAGAMLAMVRGESVATAPSRPDVAPTVPLERTARLDGIVVDDDATILPAHLVPQPPEDDPAPAPAPEPDPPAAPNEPRLVTIAERFAERAEPTFDRVGDAASRLASPWALVVMAVAVLFFIGLGGGSDTPAEAGPATEPATLAETLDEIEDLGR